MTDRGSEQGQALVEFAFILPILLMLILGLIDVARAVQEENTLAYAAREATRYAIVHGASCGSTLPSGTCAGLTRCGEVIYTNTSVTPGTRTVTVVNPDTLATYTSPTQWNGSGQWAAGTRILADSDRLSATNNMEQITVGSVSTTTITATFSKSHSGLWQITAGCSDTTIQSVVEQNAIGVPNVTAVVGYPDAGTKRGDRVFVDATAPFVPLPSQYLLNGSLTITLRGGSMLVIQN